MDHTASTGQIMINIGVQLINIALFFFVVIKFLGKPITQAIVARLEKEKKLAAADEMYNALIDEAQKKAETVLHDANIHKDNLIRQGELAAKQKYADITQDAERKATGILETANKQIALMHKDLEGHFIDAVQSTTRAVVRKIFTNKDIEETYMQKLIDEFATNTPSKFTS